MSQKAYIGVIGASRCDEPVQKIAEEVGKGIARLGAVLVCGGRGGVMEAAARGAASLNGLVVGILPGNDPREGNPHLTCAIATGLGEARNAVITRTSDIVIAIDGGYGTLSEIGLALKMGKPVVGIGTWQCVSGGSLPASIYKAGDARDAVNLCRKLLSEVKKDSG